MSELAEDIFVWFMQATEAASRVYLKVVTFAGRDYNIPDQNRAGPPSYKT